MKHQLGKNDLRMDAGAHKEKIIKYVYEMPKRGDTGPGKPQPKASEPSGARYVLPKNA